MPKRVELSAEGMVQGRQVYPGHKRQFSSIWAGKPGKQSVTTMHFLYNGVFTAVDVYTGKGYPLQDVGHKEAGSVLPRLGLLVYPKVYSFNLTSWFLVAICR